MKAVAPTGTESVAMLIPEEVTQMSILSESLAVVRADATDGCWAWASGNRPSSRTSMVEYRPVPQRAPAAKPRR